MKKRLVIRRGFRDPAVKMMTAFLAEVIELVVLQINLDFNEEISCNASFEERCPSEEAEAATGQVRCYAKIALTRNRICVVTHLYAFSYLHMAISYVAGGGIEYRQKVLREDAIEIAEVLRQVKK